MLDSVDLKVRLSKATELVDRHLQVTDYLLVNAYHPAIIIFCLLLWSHFCVTFGQSIRVAEKITQKVEGQLSKSQKEFLLRQQVSSHFSFLDFLKQWGLQNSIDCCACIRCMLLV